MKSEFVVKKAPVPLKPCPFCGKAAILKYSKGTNKYKDGSIVAPYKRPVGEPILRTNFRGLSSHAQKYEWDIWIAGCSDENCLGYGHKKLHDEFEATTLWNTRKGEKDGPC